MGCSHNIAVIYHNKLWFTKFDVVVFHLLSSLLINFFSAKIIFFFSYLVFSYFPFLTFSFLFFSNYISFSFSLYILFIFYFKNIINNLSFMFNFSMYFLYTIFFLFSYLFFCIFDLNFPTDFSFIFFVCSLSSILLSFFFYISTLLFFINTFYVSLYVVSSLCLSSYCYIFIFFNLSTFSNVFTPCFSVSSNSFSFCLFPFFLSILFTFRFPNLNCQNVLFLFVSTFYLILYNLFVQNSFCH